MSAANGGRARPQPSVIVWLTLVWVLLQGELTFANVAAGLLVALGVSWLLRLPPMGRGLRLRPLACAYLAGRQLLDMVTASVQVIALTLRPGRLPSSSVLAVQLHTRDPLLIALISGLLSLVPGSAVLELRPQEGLLYVHVLAADTTERIARSRAEALALEERVLRAFAPPARHAKRDRKGSR